MTAPIPTARNRASDLHQALRACRGSFLSAGFFSLFINVLMLLPALYMLQVYDRVLASNSESTLLMITLLAVFLFAVMGALDWVRAQILIVAGSRFDHLLGERVFDSIFAQAVRSAGAVATAHPLTDLLTLRQFLTGQGLFAFFDSPWIPIYIAVMFMLHPVLGTVAIAAAIILTGLAIWNELATSSDLKESNQRATESGNYTQRNLRNAEVIEAMGMLPHIRARWKVRQDEVLTLQARASRKGSMITVASKTFRIAIQSLILGLGAYLAIRREVTPGVVIAGSILLGRALAPIDQLIGSWRGFLAARASYRRIDDLLTNFPQRDAPMALPPPTGAIDVEQVVVKPAGASEPVIKGITFSIPAGTSVAIIGPSAAGKSTLARALLGIHSAVTGTVRLDSADISHWNREDLGMHIGYLPQDVELLDGTVSENIARFGSLDASKVVVAAKAAGVHEMILRLAAGYDTELAGNVLSSGQRQRIGLARALYGNPRLIVLDEPNSNLDQEGDAALARTLADLKQSACTVLVVTHRSNMLGLVDRILLLMDGRIAAYDERDKVLALLQQQHGAQGAGTMSPGQAERARAGTT